MGGRILVVDDEVSVRFTLEEILTEEGYDVVLAADGQGALALCEDVDLVVTDLQMPGMDGMALLARMSAQLPQIPVVMLTARGSELAAVQAMKLGAFDYVPKPFELEGLLQTVARALGFRRQSVERRVLLAQHQTDTQVVAQSVAMKRVLSMVERLARRPVTTLIRGETGTGKEVVASLLHAMSGRASSPMVRFNCAALPDALAEAELFGHEAGAYTGAHTARPGYIRQADGGTLMLDEVGELSLPVQAKLLRFVQEGEIQPLGAGRAEQVDVRLVACTHQALEEQVAAGEFRQDLYYRLAVVEIDVPPLRARTEDIAPLARLFMARYANRFGVEVFGMEEALLEAMVAYSWPGNVRQLENTVARLVALSTQPTLLLSDWSRGPMDHKLSASELPSKSYREQMFAHERRVLSQAMERASGNRSEAARLLEMSRTTLIDKLKRHQLLE